MTRCVLVLLLAWSAPAVAEDYDFSVGAGPAVFVVGDVNGTAVSTFGRIDYQPLAWFQIGVQAQVVTGRNSFGERRRVTQAVLGVVPRLRIADRFELGTGVGVTQRLGATQMPEGVTPVVLISAGATLYRAASSTFGLELDVFAGDGDDESPFPDERMGISVGALATW